MEVLRDTHFDFLGRKWWFILPSLVLILAGVVSLVINGGPRYSIDFLGGAVMDVRWNGAPPIARIRAVASSRLSGVSVVAAHDLTGSNEILASAETPNYAEPGALRQTMVEVEKTKDEWYARVDSNHRPFAPEANALSS